MNRILTAVSNDIETHPLKDRDYSTLNNNLESNQELDMASWKPSISKLSAHIKVTAARGYLSVKVSVLLQSSVISHSSFKALSVSTYA